MDKQDIVIVAARRTPVGNLLGTLASFTAPELAAVVHRTLLEETNTKASDLYEVITGCVLTAGLGQAPARQATLKAGIPNSVGATTLNKMCGSGMKAVMLAHDLIQVAPERIILAGGMESMSNAPYLLPKARRGYRLGHGEFYDHMFLDGLEDAYERGKLMGVFAEATASHFQITREEQDEYARHSLQRALHAQSTQAFAEEIIPISVMERDKTHVVAHDEGPQASKLDKIARLKPSFKANGTITPANSSSISDGAAGLLLMSAHEAKKRDLKPLARIVAYSSHAEAPQWFTTAPIAAIQKLWQKTGWNAQDIDLYEINEAFAVVSMVAIRELGLDASRVNVNGGACALGHPIGATGARILVTLLHALRARHKKRGIAALCIGGGEATAIAVECMD